MRQHPLAVLSLAVFLAATAPGVARAQQRVGAIRAGVGFPDMVGVSASVRPLRLLEGEAGASLFGFFPHYYVRLGGVLPLIDKERFDLELVGQAGDRTFADVPDQGPDAVAGVDVCWWAYRHVGLTGQVVGGAFYDLDDRQTWPVMRFRVGVAIAIGGSRPEPLPRAASDADSPNGR